MSWTYHQLTGNLIDPNGHIRSLGYSGHGEGLNNPDCEDIRSVGPIPSGTWSIGTFFDDKEKGPLVCHLLPVSGTETFNRDGFMIHGDNEEMNHTASDGCIILSRWAREQILSSNDRILVVKK